MWNTLHLHRPQVLYYRDKRHLNYLTDTDPETTIVEITMGSGCGHIVGNTAWSKDMFLPNI